MKCKFIAFSRECGDISSFSHTSCDSCAACPGKLAWNVGSRFACSYKPYLNEAAYNNLHFLQKTRTKKKEKTVTSAPTANAVTASARRAGRVREKFCPRRDVTPARPAVRGRHPKFLGLILSPCSAPSICLTSGH